MRSAILVSLIAVLSTGCGPADDSTAAGDAGTAATLPENDASAAADAAGTEAAVALAGDWRLVSIGGTWVAAELETPTLTVNADGQVGGFSGVNRFMGRLGGQDGRLFTPLAGTMMAGPPPAMALESSVTAALGEVMAYEVDGDRLTLMSSAGDLVYTRAD